MATEIIRLWPLILIGIGLGLLLRFTRFEAVGGVVVAGTAGLLLGSLLTGGIPSAAAACGSNAVSGTPVVREGAFSAAPATVNLELNCADVEIGRTADATWHLETIATVTPDVTADADSLTLRSAQRQNTFFGGDNRESWRAQLAGGVPLAIQSTLNGSSGRLDLSQGPLQRLGATFNASDVRLDLPAAEETGVTRLDATANASSVLLVLGQADVSASMTLNAASLTVCTASGVGLSIHYSDTLSSQNFSAAGLISENGVWQTPGFAQASSQVQLDMTANVSSTTVNPAGGCQ